MCDPVSKAELFAGCRGVAAADDGDGIRVSQRLCNGNGTLGKRRVFKHAHRAVPDDGFCILDCICIQCHGLGTDVQTLHICGDLVGVHNADLDRCIDRVGEACGNRGVDGQEQLDALFLCLLHHFRTVFDLLTVKQGLADAVALCGKEGVCHTAADNQGVDLAEQVVDNIQFVGDLCAAENGNEGTFRIRQSLAHDRDFFFNQEAADGGHSGVLCYAGSGSMCAVRSAECVIDKNVRKCSELAGEFLAVLFLVCGETGVLQKNDVAGLHSGNLFLCVRTDGIRCKDHTAAEQLVELVGNNGKGALFQILLCLFQCGSGCSLLLFCRQSGDCGGFFLVQFDFGIENIVGFAHVRAKDDHCACVTQELDGRKRFDNPLVGGDYAVLHRYVEVAPYQTFFSGNVNVPDRLFVVRHFFIHLSGKFLHIHYSTLPYPCQSFSRKKIV